MKFLIIIVLVSIYLKNGATLDCYWNRELKYRYFSSKTPYEIVRGDIRDTFIKPKGCEPISVWAMIRHGKRNPGTKFAKYIKEILTFKDYIISSYENGNSTLCAQDVENLRNWKIDDTILDEPNAISNEGFQEVLGIGSRLKETIPELLNYLQIDDYLFQPSPTDRVEESAKTFIEGLKNKNLHITRARNNYSIAAPYLSCERYQTKVFQNPGIYHQVVQYMATADFLNMKERIETRLGLNRTLTNNNIIAMYDVCRYSWEGIANKPSPWCAMFSVEDFQVLEYVGDLELYYRNGYGTTYSNMFGQIPLSDLFTNFEQAKNGKGKKIVSYFTHSSMLSMALVALNLNKDEKTLTGAYRDVNRKWRTTFTAAFSANMITVLNRCKEAGGHEYNYNIVFYWNEEPLLELCNGGVCSWYEFEEKFKLFLNTTKDYCEINNL